MVDVENLHLELTGASGPVKILRGIDLAIAAHETVAVVGPSGSGKSTMMMVIAGLERASAGRVAVAGHELGSMDENALAVLRRETIGIVFQAFHLVPTMSALENVAVPLELAGRTDAFDVAGARLDEVGLSHRLAHYPSQLSGGEQQRVALARAFAPQPKLLVADEPTGNLDAETGAVVIDALFALHRAHGSTLMLITHDEAVASRCGRILRLLDGRIVAEGVAGGVAAGGVAGGQAP
ncbi:MAG: ATP-binding cassette domain-containing protein [Alphaproteobacteria bacterium]|nr:ATP-binding cassette domain-containing protein [Alphaproteobacteria bacterium]